MHWESLLLIQSHKFIAKARRNYKDEKISPTVNPDAVKIMCSMCLQLDMTMETRDQAEGYLHAVYPDDAEPVYVRAPQYLDKILKNNP